MSNDAPNIDFRIIESAYKHGIERADVEYVYLNSLSGVVLHDDPRKVMLFGWDTSGRALEVGYFCDDDGTKIVMHAQPIRKTYKKHLEDWKRYQLLEEIS